MADTLVHSARLVTAKNGRGVSDLSDAWVHMRDGTIVGIGVGSSWRGSTPAPDSIIDARSTVGPGALLTPGLVDIHNHGGGGHGFDGTPSDIVAGVDTHLRHGVTSIVLSLVSAHVDTLIVQLTRIKDAAAVSPSILGAHLEGPFIDKRHCGAHDHAVLRAPDPMLLTRLLETDIVRQVTLAPELDGGIAAVRIIEAAGATAAVGHTGADADTAQAAFDSGSRLLTHTFNAMPPLHHRAPGPVGAAISDRRVTLEIVPDGHHLDPLVVALLFQAAPERIAIVSDAIAAAAAPDGLYPLGTLTAEVVGGAAHIQGTTTIAGSTLTLDQALRNCVDFGVPLPAAVHAATAAPARVIGRPDLGVLAEGSPADVVLWREGLEVAHVWKAGEQVD